MTFATALQRAGMRIGREPAASPGVAAAERVVAAIIVFCLGMKTSIHAGITVGTVLGLLMVPVWGPEIRRRGRFAIALFVLSALALFSGLALTWASSSDHSISTRQIITFTALLAQFVVGAGVLWWAQRPLGIRMMGVIFGAGVLAQGVLVGAEGTGNPWKTLYAVPLAMILLSLTYKARTRMWDVVVLLVLAGASATQDSRSYSATFLIALTLVLWQMRPQTMTRRTSSWLTAAFIAAIGWAVYRLGQALLVAGYLGANAQARTIAQIRQAGSLIYGGRPELKATLALIRDDLWGHGLGVLANFHDLNVAKSALSSVIYNPNNGYVEHFMFGTDIELHSNFGDLWTHFGLAGIALCVLIAAVALRAVIVMVSRREASGLVLFLGAWSLWNLLFSPFYSSLTQLILLFGIVAYRPDEPSTPVPATGDQSSGGNRHPLETATQHGD